MGVPGLSKALKAYAVPTVFGCKDPSCEKHSPHSDFSSTNVIIDGPSFAYCVYNRLNAHKSAQLSALEAVPSYRDIGNGAMTFLNELENHGLLV